MTMWESSLALVNQVVILTISYITIDKIGFVTCNFVSPGDNTNIQQRNQIMSGKF
jgi:hypothetical protein